MANARSGRQGRTKRDNSREPGSFIAIPRSVLESPAYLGLSANARSLLLEVALQCRGDDNGRLLLSRAYLRKRGLTSADMIDKGKRELIEAELIFETVKGHRPNKASWYALTWRSLDRITGFDPGVETAFKRGAYRDARPTKIAVLSPRGGPGKHSIDPHGGTEKAASVPQGGAMRAISGTLPVPPCGHPLEKPSRAGVSQRAASRRLMGRLLGRRSNILSKLLRPNGYHEAPLRVAAGLRAKKV